MTTDRTTPANQPYQRTATRHVGAAEPAIWEPISFEVGDCVKVLPRPECFYCRGADDEDGLIGVVEAIISPSDRNGFLCGEAGSEAHRSWVAFPGVVPSHGTRTSHFAACELVPVDGDEDDG